MDSSPRSGNVNAGTVGAEVMRSVLEFWAGRGRRTSLPVQGTSMWPLLRTGERVIVRHAMGDPRTGQVVVVLQAGRTIAHRVIALRRTGERLELRTKGDCTMVADPGWIGRESIVGVVEGVAAGEQVRDRLGLDGWIGGVIAILSRFQGWVCGPVQTTRRLLVSRRSGAGTSRLLTDRIPATHRLLLLSLPTGRPEDARELAELARAPLDWSEVIDRGHRIGALPLLGAALEAAGAPVPAKVRDRCGEALVHGTLRSLVASRLLDEINRALHGAGIEPLVLKGLALAFDLYDQPGLRPVGDLDLLVPRMRRDRAIEALLAAGFAPPGGSLPPGFFRRHHFHVTLVRPGREGIPVELHWELQPRFSPSHIPGDEFAARRRPLPIGATRAWIPGREEAFLYLAQHLVRHLLVFGEETAADPVGALLEPARRGRLTWIADLVLLARRPPGLDWELVERLAARWGLDQDIAGIRWFLSSRGLAPAEGIGGLRGEGRLRLVRRVEALVPSSAGATTALQLRPILILELARAAWPGTTAIRRRYGLPWRGAWLPVAARSTTHACHILAAALGMLGAAVACRVGQAVRSRFTK